MGEEKKKKKYVLIATAAVVVVVVSLYIYISQKNEIILLSEKSFIP